MNFYRTIVILILCCSGLFATCQVPGWAWVNTSNAAFQQGGTVGISMCTDNSGNVYACGQYSTSISFDNYTLSGGNAFLVKYDALGNLLWAENYEAGLGQSNLMIADSSGNVFMVADFSTNMLVLGNDSINTGNDDILYIKVSPAGHIIGYKTITGTNHNSATCLTIDTRGNIYVAGTFSRGSITIDSFTIQTNSIYNMFVAKLNSDGNALWLKGADADAIANALTIGTDASENVYVTGGYSVNSLILDSDTLPAGTNLFIVKYDTAGNVIWAKNGFGFANQLSAATDIKGNTYIAGTFSSASLIFGTDTLKKASNYNQTIFVGKYNQNGDFDWAESPGAGAVGNIVSLDKVGNIYIGGSYYQQTLIWGRDTLENTEFNILTQSGTGNTYVVRLDTSGGVLWAKNVGGKGNVFPYGFWASGTGDVYITGGYNDTIEFDNDTLPLASKEEFFLGKIGICPAAGAPVNTTSAAALSIDSGQSTMLSATGEGTLSWYSADTGGIYLYAGESFVTPPLSETDTFYVQDSTCGPSARTAIVVNVVPPGTKTGINASGTPYNIKVFPNPAKDNVWFSGLDAGDLIEVYDVLGNVINTTLTKNMQLSLNLAGKASGIYFYRITYNDKFIDTGKIILY